jgi:hypothetical protein
VRLVRAGLETNNTIDWKGVTPEIAAMKYLPYFLLASATALSLATSEGGTTTQTQLGPHGAQNFALIPHTGRVFNENDPNFARNVALVVKVEQRMTKEGQEITASAFAHKDGPTGTLFSVDGLRVHVTAPVEFATDPNKTGGVHITKTIPAPGGKFKTVTAEATFSSSNYAAAHVSVTVPGDK